MKRICLNNTRVEGYSAPKCRIFSVCVENCIAQNSPGDPGEPGSSDSYKDYEDD